MKNISPQETRYSYSIRRLCFEISSDNILSFICPLFLSTQFSLEAVISCTHGCVIANFRDISLFSILILYRRATDQILFFTPQLVFDVIFFTICKISRTLSFSFFLDKHFKLYHFFIGTFNSLSIIGEFFVCQSFLNPIFQHGRNWRAQYFILKNCHEWEISIELWT